MPQSPKRTDAKAPAAAKITQHEIRTMRIADLNPAPYNPRTITSDALDGLQTSLQRFGQVQPIVWNKRTKNIVGGHQRVSALARAGVTEAQVLVVDLDKPEERALNITLNNPHIEGTFTDGLQELLADLKATMPEPFEDLRLDALLKEDPDSGGTVDLDAIPAAPATPITKPGDLWVMGAHRLLCGDSTNPDNIKRLFGSEKASCVFTDPPYGVSYEAKSGKFEMIKNDDLRDDALLKLLVPAFKNAAAIAKEEAAFYIWHASSTREDFAYAMKAAGIIERQYLIWAKNGFSMGFSDYHWSHEPCFYASKSEKKAAFYGGVTDSTIWRVSNVARGQIETTLGSGLVVTDGEGNRVYIQPKPPKAKKLRIVRVGKGDKLFLSGNDKAGSVWEVARDTDMEHPTQKPAELAIRAIRNSTRDGEIVFDPFLGSGTTLIGAEHTSRLCYGCELDPKYADVIVGRWEKLTGRKARAERI